MQYGEFIAQNRSIQHDKSCPVIGSKGHGHKKIPHMQIYAGLFNKLLTILCESVNQ